MASPASRDERTAPAATRCESPVELSVIIVNHNVKDFLLQCLRSLESAMRGIAGEVLVVDNHSTDGSIGYLAPLFPSIDFIGLPENVGFGRANNVALARARGQYVLFLNPDTLLEEHTLDVMLAYMRSHPDVGMSGCRILNPDGTFQLACRRAFPSPWAAFCKAFGLQALFPRSRLFARYNQTFRSENETHFVDAISGSFMFGRTTALEQSGGFDPEFFMYGEDLDLCYRITKAGWKIAYVHDTSLIHYKGESTRRSSLDRVAVFYQAMTIFARKHHGRSSLFLLLLRLGIALRSVLAYANQHRQALLVLAVDVTCINAALLAATRVRFGSYFGFPAYAYPGVFVALSAATVGSMLAAGEYFESKPSVRKAFAGLMVNFFALTTLTYFFKDYAFSRGVLLMTISAALVASALVRVAASAYDRSVGRHRDRRIALVGTNERTARILGALQTAETRNAVVVGVVATEETGLASFSGVPVLGHVAALQNLIEEHRIHEVVMTDDRLPNQQVMELLSAARALSVRFHVAHEYEEVVAARIINEVAGIEPTLPEYAITSLRYRAAKRVIDLAGAGLLLSIGLPLVYFAAPDFSREVRRLWSVLAGRYSLIGLYPTGAGRSAFGKVGLTGLAHISRPERLSPEVIGELNDYYIRRYSLSLDFDIFVKSIFRHLNG